MILHCRNRRGSCFSASIATKLANKLQEKLHSKAASVLRSCEDLPLLCYLLSCATLAWLHDNRPKRELARGQEVAWPACRCRIHKHVKCYNHRLFCFTVQNFVIKKRGNLLTPAPNKFFLLFFPVSAFYAENFSKQISFNAHIWTKSKFLGLSVGVENIGQGNRNTFSRELQAWKILAKGNILFRKFSKSWRG